MPQMQLPRYSGFPSALMRGRLSLEQQIFLVSLRLTTFSEDEAQEVDINDRGLEEAQPRHGNSQQRCCLSAQRQVQSPASRMLSV